MKTIGNKKTKILCVVLTALCMLFIFCMSAEPASESDKTSGFFVRLFASLLGVEQTGIFITLVRKLAHITEYAFLGACACLFAFHFKANTVLRLCLSFMFSSLYALTDELHQYFVPGRACRFTDICIDSFGAILGIMLIFAIIYAIHKIKEKKL
ncbi:MAG: VanZ family protein [Clostridia bacterium]|nr:VanZ family protein [Clostridia bacterium]